MQIVTLSADELDARIEAAVARALAADPAREPWLDTAACADHLSTTQNSIRDMVKRLGLPAHRAPGTARLLFRPSEVDQWIAGRAT